MLKRKNIMIREDQETRLRNIRHETRESESSLIRRALDAFLPHQEKTHAEKTPPKD